MSAERRNDHGLHQARGDPQDLWRGAIDVPVLRGVSVSIARREMVALMGVSGAGKTTLINLLGFLYRPTSGRHSFNGRDVTGLSEAERAWLRSREVGFVFQNFNLLPRMTALENVMMPSVYGSHEFSERQYRIRRGRSSSGSAWEIASITSHHSSPAANNNASRLPAHSLTAARY